LLQLRCSTLADRLSDYGEIARRPVRPANMGETQEIKGLRTSLSPLFPSFGGVTPEFKQARFHWVQFQPEFPHAFLQVLQEALGFISELEPQHGIISIPDDDHIAPRLAPPLVCPEIESVV
jgi:hypothetical protein